MLCVRYKPTVTSLIEIELVERYLTLEPLGQETELYHWATQTIAHILLGIEWNIEGALHFYRYFDIWEVWMKHVKNGFVYDRTTFSNIELLFENASGEAVTVGGDRYVRMMIFVAGLR